MSPSSAIESWQRDVAVLVALARLRQQVRRVGHRLHAAGDDDVELAGPDELVGQRDRVEAGQADLVDRQRGHVHRDAALDRGLAGGDLAGAGLEHLAHDHVLDLVGRDARALERGLDRDAAEVGGGEVLERAEQPAHRGARSGDDDRGSDAHGGPSFDTGMGTRHDTAVSSPSPAEVLGPVVTAIDHVGIAVRDLDDAIAFYGRTFGLPLRAPRDQRGAGRRGGDGRRSATRASSCCRRCRRTRRSRSSSTATARASSRSRSASSTSTTRRGGCARPAYACSTTPPAAAPPARGSTSSTPRTPAASSSSSSSPPPTRSTEARRH